MSAAAGAGSLSITACRAGPRTILERIRYDGISRCSRAFAHGDAALVVLSQLGPGVVRGDSVHTQGHVRAGARLVVTSQSATRLLGGARRSQAHSRWQLDERAVLELIGEPLVASPDARYDAFTTIDLHAGSIVLVSEIARVPPGAEVRLRTRVCQAGRELFYDAVDAAAAAPHAVGTLALVGLDQARIPATVAALDHAVDGLRDVRAGVGAHPKGAFVRLIATDLWAVRAGLITLRQAVWTASSKFAPSDQGI